MASALLLSRVLGLLRDTAMARNFGIQFDADCYRIAVTVPDMIFFLIAGGGLSSAFIPIFSEFLHKDREDDAWRVFSVVTTLSTIMVTALIAVAWGFAPQIASFMAAGKTHTSSTGQLVPLSHADLDKIVLMSRIMLPAQLAFMVGSVLIATLYARRQFVAPGVAPNVYNVGIIAGAFIGPWIGIGIVGMSWGALIGAIIGNLVIPTLVMLRLGGHFRPSVDINTPGVKQFFRLLLPVILGFSLPSVAALITQKFASAYNEGTNIVLSAGNNLMQAPLGIFGQSLALAAFPVLAQFYALRQMDRYRAQISNTLRTVTYLGVASASILFALAPQIVQLVYGYGKGANSEQLANIVLALRIYAVGIPAWCLQPVLMRGFFSLHKTLKPVVIGTIMTALFIAMCWGVLALGLGYQGLPWATNIAAVLLAIFLYAGLQKDVGSMDLGGLLTTLGKSVVAASVMGAFAWAAFLPFPHLHKIPLFFLFLLVCILAGWIYFYATRAMKMPETSYLDRALKKMDRRKRPISEEEAGGL